MEDNDLVGSEEDVNAEASIVFTVPDTVFGRHNNELSKSAQSLPHSTLDIGVKHVMSISENRTPAKSQDSQISKASSNTFSKQKESMLKHPAEPINVIAAENDKAQISTEDTAVGIASEKFSADLPANLPPSDEIDDRHELLVALQKAFLRREELQKINTSLQTKLGTYFRKRKTDGASRPNANTVEQERRYLAHLKKLETMRKTLIFKSVSYDETIRNLQERCREKLKLVVEERHHFMKFKYMVAKNAISRRTGTTIPDKELERFKELEQRKENDLTNMRLECIRRKNKLAQQEQQLKLKEKVGKGLSLIDFEQLKIENQTYNEKIEERNEELLKLRKKITTNVQVLTHLKEKLQWLQRVNQEHSAHLQEKDAAAAAKRDILSRLKKVRDLLRRDNSKLRIDGGLRGNHILLRDFENQYDQLDDILAKINAQKSLHAELTLNITHIQKKIDRIKIKNTK